MLRVVAIYLCSAGTYHLGWLNAYTAAGIMLIGFFVETAVAWQASKPVRSAVIRPEGSL